MTDQEKDKILGDLKEAHHRHKKTINRALKKAGVPLRVRSIQYEPAPEVKEAATLAPTPFAKCCFIDGHFVCGPQCP
jgi:hypothetical protein